MEEPRLDEIVAEAEDGRYDPVTVLELVAEVRRLMEESQRLRECLASCEGNDCANNSCRQFQP